MTTLRCLFVSLGAWRRKGLPLLLQAIDLTSQRGVCFCVLDVVGRPGSGEEELLAPFTRLVNDGRVRLHGHCEDVERFYCETDVLLVASHVEAFSLVMLDALRFGVPVVTGPVNGAEEMVEDGVNGYIVERRPEAFADRLELLAADPDLRRRLAAAARMRAERFRVSEVGRQTELVYRQAASAGVR